MAEYKNVKCKRCGEEITIAAGEDNLCDDCLYHEGEQELCIIIDGQDLSPDQLEALSRKLAILLEHEKLEGRITGFEAGNSVEFPGVELTEELEKFVKEFGDHLYVLKRSFKFLREHHLPLCSTEEMIERIGNLNYYWDGEIYDWIYDG